MPYIKQEQRKGVDPIIDSLINQIKGMDVEDQDGTLNYVVTKVIKSVYPKKYFHLNRAMGVLSAITQELYRKIIGPYEEEKISENGDI